METRTKSRLILLGLVLIVGLSAYLRLSGITWAIKDFASIRLGSSEGEPGYGHYLSFHPDEFISIRGMSAINLLAGKVKAPDAYFEGTFNYYLWAVPRMFYDLCSGKGTVARQKLSAGQLKFILLSGRLMTVAFDLAALVFLFAIISELTNQRLPALLGALLYGVFPMQVIYSHFMRTYALANLLCVLVIWLSLKALKHRHWFLFVITGVAAGLAAATRYPAGFILSVPCALVLFQGDATNGSWRQRFGKSFVYLLSGPLWLLASGFVLGLFVGEPMLFLDFRSVLDSILFEASQYSPAGARNPFDLTPIWKYISVLIPHATYPVLWLLIYVSTIYVILRPSLWPTVVPLCLFAMLYTYSMAKGYLDAFARLTMLLMPVLCIFAGVAWGDILPKIVKRPPVFRLAIIVMVLLIIPSIVFDWAYDQAMKRRDVREQLRNDMRDLISDRSATSIAVSESGCYFYTAMPAVLPLKSNNVAVQLERSFVTPADFLVIGFERPLSESSRNSTIRKVESGGTFRFVKAYSRAPTVFGKTLNWSKFPVDMTYPFPTILLFSKVITPYKAVETADGSRSGVPPLPILPRSHDVFAKPAYAATH
jgi:Dolichyl-phosphate-mannose-protein mannosyltransferase